MAVDIFIEVLLGLLNILILFLLQAALFSPRSGK